MIILNKTLSKHSHAKYNFQLVYHNAATLLIFTSIADLNMLKIKHIYFISNRIIKFTIERILLSLILEEIRQNKFSEFPQIVCAG